MSSLISQTLLFLIYASFIHIVILFYKSFCNQIKLLTYGKKSGVSELYSLLIFYIGFYKRLTLFSLIIFYELCF